MELPDIAANFKYGFLYILVQFFLNIQYNMSIEKITIDLCQKYWIVYNRSMDSFVKKMKLIKIQYHFHI